MKSHGKYRGLLFVISGPSGSGKTTLAESLLKSRALKNKLIKSLSLTTRPKRSGEKNKRDYSFVSAAQFRRRLKNKKILEWTKYLGYYYGTPKDFIDKQIKLGRHTVLCLDLKGAGRLKQLYPKNSVTIFVLPPSLRELRRRIKQRCRQAKAEEIEKRVRLAKKELLAVAKYDHCLVNKHFQKALSRLRGITLQEISQREGS